MNIEGENDQRKEGVQICPEESSNSIDNLIKLLQCQLYFNSVHFITIQFYLVKLCCGIQITSLLRKSFIDDWLKDHKEIIIRRSSFEDHWKITGYLTDNHRMIGGWSRPSRTCQSWTRPEANQAEPASHSRLTFCTSQSIERRCPVVLGAGIWDQLG